MIINKLYIWAKKYFLNIFGVIGVLGTFYFSLFYAPGYVDQLLSGRASVIHESIVNDVQELLFNDETISTDEIESLIKGKELNNGTEYKYNVDELLVQIEDRFMSNKFIPLKRRKELVNTINKIRTNYKPHKQQKSYNSIWKNVSPWALSIIGIFFCFLGLISLADKYKREKEIEVDIESETQIKEKQTRTSSLESYIEYEKMIKEILLENNIHILGEEPNHPGKPVSRPDFEVSINNQAFLIECKKYKKLVGLSTVTQVLYQAMEHAKPSILISTTNLTSRASEALSKHNHSNPDLLIYSVIGTQKESIKNQLISIMK